MGEGVRRANGGAAVSDLPTSQSAILAAYPKITAWLRTLSRHDELALEVARMQIDITKANQRANARDREIARLRQELAYITALVCTCHDSRYKRCAVHPPTTTNTKEPTS